MSRQGAKKQGIREHVKVRKKHDSAGVGAVRWLAAPFIFAVASMVVRACRRRLTGRAVQVEAVKQARDWTLGMAAFDRVLAALNQAPAAPAGAGPEAGPDTLGAQPQVAAADDGAGIPAAEPPRKRRKAAPASGAAEGKRQRACAAADACASGAPAEPEPRGKRRKRAGAQGDGAQAALDGATAAAGALPSPPQRRPGLRRAAPMRRPRARAARAAATWRASRAGGAARMRAATLARTWRPSSARRRSPASTPTNARCRWTARARRALPVRPLMAAIAAWAADSRAELAGRPLRRCLVLPPPAARSRNMSGGCAGAGGAPAEEAEAPAPARAPDPEDAWWRRCFVRAGRLGSQAQAAADAAAGLQPARPKVRPPRGWFALAMVMCRVTCVLAGCCCCMESLLSGSDVGLCARQIKVAGFSEDDQANLYMAAHDASGKGRQGLGIASRPKKIAGARWQVRTGWPPCGSAPRRA